MDHKPGADSVIRKAGQLKAILAIRSGLVNMIPILIIGAFALILNTFPVEAYQQFLKSEAGSFLSGLFELINKATFGVLAVYMTFFISRSYMKLQEDLDQVSSGAIVASLLSFFILAGVNLEDFGTGSLGPKSMFLAIITALGASSLYAVLHRKLRGRSRYLLSQSADPELNRALSTLLPVTITALVFALINALVVRFFDVDSFRMLIIGAFNRLFSHGKPGFVKGFFFVLLSSLLWFFGIHGSDTLEGVMQNYFTGVALKQAAAAGDAAAIEATKFATSPILTKEFFDCFVLMGGCGSAICLLIAILLFSRSRSRRGLGLTAAFPMIFNINELMVFGLPIIFNPVMLIPFLAVPLVCYSVAYLATTLGLVPVISNAIEWTTPIILGGYKATGSIAGSLMQLFNVILGVAIYSPFVRMLDKQSEAAGRRRFAAFVEYFERNESDLSSIRLTALNNRYGDIAKELAAELRDDMDRYLNLAYQPQYHYDGRCVGVEALLRWKHPTYGIIYPPLIFKLAGECGLLATMEEHVFDRALADRPAVLKRFGENVKLSVNITGPTVTTPRFLKYCREKNAAEPFEGRNICLEVTEQATLSLGSKALEALQELREMGLMLAIDDFSMGQTSVQYLRTNLFNLIKLDGSLVRGLDDQQNCREIIRSVTQLAESLDLSVLAEYVETEQQRETLHEIGCDRYQGYLYSPAVYLTDAK